jgi:hypothetical protein
MTLTSVDLGNSSDWCEVFAYAGGGDGHHGSGVPVPAPAESNIDCSPFGIADVETVIGAVEGEHDGDSWVIAVVLKDGRFAVLEASCDYTGWD